MSRPPEGLPVRFRSGTVGHATPPDSLVGMGYELCRPGELSDRAGGQMSDQLSLVTFSTRDSVDAGPSGATAIPLEPLGASLQERWRSSRSVEHLRVGGFGLADDGLLVFGHGLFDAGPQVDLERTTRSAYAQLLECCAERGAEHLFRVWNVVPAINEPQRGIERYKLFCKGRAEGYLEHFGPERMEGALPASSAVGGATDRLAITFLASRVAGRHVENPRQVSAYRYPPEYGPRSPSFARATVVPGVAGGWVFISGTASIVGHQSRHVGDLTAQLEETIRNVAVLFEAIDGAPCDEVDIARRMVSLRVYLRRGADWPFVSATLRERLGTNVVLMGLAADICRRELLIEIEAVARPR